jgi:hypothetical protein
MLVEQFLTPKEPEQDVFLMPDPNLHEIISNLGNRSKRVRLDALQLKALKRGKSFLAAARRGHEISRRAVTEQAIEGEKSDFRVYKIVETAMSQYMQDQSVSLIDIFTSVENALNAFLGKQKRILGNADDTKLAALFFKSINNVRLNTDAKSVKKSFQYFWFSYLGSFIFKSFRSKNFARLTTCHLHQ